MRGSSEDNANVRVPPPLIFMLPLGLGLWLHHVIPLVQLPPAPGGLVRRVGAVVVILAVLLTAWAMVSFRRMRTSVIPVQPASALVMLGPYRFSRNPMYLAMTLLYLGVAVWARALWPLLFLPVILVIMQKAVIGREEAYLTRRFGDEYRRYLAQVRRWI
jgi:protein-S-isoprenylcysteine O-methyltransferase Ste14